MKRTTRAWVLTLMSIVFLFGTLGVAHGSRSGRSVYVRGYFRKDGTYVRPHYRSAPDGNPYNNWSFPGNVNPYTGKVAPGNPDTYLWNYYNRRSEIPGGVVISPFWVPDSTGKAAYNPDAQLSEKVLTMTGMKALLPGVDPKNFSLRDTLIVVMKLSFKASVEKMGYQVSNPTGLLIPELLDVVTEQAYEESKHSGSPLSKSSIRRVLESKMKKDFVDTISALGYQVPSTERMTPEEVVKVVEAQIRNRERNAVPSK
jgi:hypothetical protein